MNKISALIGITRELALSLYSPPHEDTMRSVQSATQKRVLPQIMTMLAP